VNLGQYSAKVLDYFFHPRCIGRLAPCDGTGRIGDPGCGDFLEMTLRLSDDNSVLSEIAYQVKGCPAAIAVAGITAEMMTGVTVETAAALTEQTIISALDGLPPGKEHCSVLAVKALHLALKEAMLRRLFRKAGLAPTDEDFERLRQDERFEHYFHDCDGSCQDTD
jgi:nitrogen fixation NifU-like protein